MAKNYQYCVAENWGKGFIEAQESIKINFLGLPGNIWRVPAYNKHANLWIAKVGGVLKTKDEAQAIVDSEITALQTSWDNATEEEKLDRKRPENIVLEE